MFESLDMGASGLQAQRTRLDTIAANILNIHTTRNAQGQRMPYRRRFVLFAPGQAGNVNKPGVHVQKIDVDKTPFQQRFDPTHPDADPKTGYVSYPNIDLSMEYVNALEASRAYEANVTMMEVSKAMINASLRLLA
jgi:flagellar basal-body rod protein FlgC